LYGSALFKETIVRRLATATIAILALSTAACKRTADGKTEVTLPTVDVDVGTKKDTVGTPGVTTKPETVIVNKPVITPPPPQQ
jgi:hypothetical protein